MTCNPQWKEVTDNLEPNENPCDRIDLLDRVFKMKLNALVKDIFERHVLGFTVGRIIVVEFQQRGLPHAHILIIMDSSDRPITPDQFDRLFQATIPDAKKEPLLFKRVSSHHTHDCGLELCLDDNGNCRYFFDQHEFCNYTTLYSNERIKWRRPDDGRFITKFCKKRNKNIIFDNRNIVPYNPALLLKYDCHLFFDICTTKIASVRYIFSYVLKGEDYASAKIRKIESIKKGVIHENNEIELFLNGRMISAEEAYWKIMEFPIVEIRPPTEPLPVHLPGKNTINTNILYKIYKSKTLQEKQEAQKRLEKGATSKLTAFFELNKKRKLLSNNNIFDDDLFYKEISISHVWHQSSQTWQPRERFYNSDITLNRLNIVPIQDSERYYLRILLHEIPNPISFEDLCTYKNKKYNTFQETCSARGLLDDDVQWQDTISEAISYFSPSVARKVFCYILVYSHPANACKLWNDNKKELCHDFMKDDLHTLFSHKIEQLGLKDINKKLKDLRRSLMDYQLMPQIEKDDVDSKPEIDINKYKERYKIAYEKAEPEKQKPFLSDMFKYLENPNLYKDKCIFLNAAAGCGKTFCLDAVIDKCISLYGEESVVVVSSTAISAQQFKNKARTAHFTFKLPVNYNDAKMIRCNIDLDSSRADRLKKVKLIVWDEVVTMIRQFIEAVDYLFKDLLNKQKLLGGIMFIISGDVGQTLPKIDGKSSKSLLLDSLFCKSPLFQYFKIYELTKNLRLSLNVNAIDKSEFEDYEHFLLQVRDGTYACDELDKIKLPKYLKQCKEKNDIIKFVYSNKFSDLTDDDFGNRAIVTPLNENVTKLNDYIIDNYIHSKKREYFGTDKEDTYEKGHKDLLLPLEVLHNMNPSGFPKYKLVLKKGAIVICLRNLEFGLANGTKLKVIEMYEHNLVLKILTGPNKNEIVHLPRITLSQRLKSEATLLVRKQFPINLAYALTIDKSQGQSLKRVGIYLCSECFAHGQLYTALSRATNPKMLCYYIGLTGEQECTTNVVWKEVFSLLK